MDCFARSWARIRATRGRYWVRTPSRAMTPSGFACNIHSGTATSPICQAVSEQNSFTAFTEICLPSRGFNCFLAASVIANRWNVVAPFSVVAEIVMGGIARGLLTI